MVLAKHYDGMTLRKVAVTFTDGKRFETEMYIRGKSKMEIEKELRKHYGRFLSGWALLKG